MHFQDESQWSIENKLQIQFAKSNFMFNGSSYYLNDNNIEQPITTNNTAVSRICTHNCVGLNWKTWLRMLNSNDLQEISCRHRSCESYQGFRSYGNTGKGLQEPCTALFWILPPTLPQVWNNSGKLLEDKLQRFQSRAPRVLTDAGYHKSFSWLNWLSFSFSWWKTPLCQVKFWYKKY